MKIEIVKDYKAMSLRAAELIKEQVQEKKNSILGLATGSTPIDAYKKLIEWYQDKEISFKDIITFNLDEYVGIKETHPLSYHVFMNENLFNHIDIKRENIHLPENSGDLETIGKEYDKHIEASGGIDLQILGIGENGHIAFNEPGSDFEQGTREVNLTESTIKANSRFFDDISLVPKTAITMGIGTILKSKKIVLLASGEKKAQAIYDTIKGPISPNCPASYLQTHKDVTIIVDELAASKLK